MASHGARRLLGAWTIAICLILVALSAPTRSATTDSSPGVVSVSANSPFVYGIFEDANYVRGPDDFRLRLHDLIDRNFSALLFTNNVVDRDEPLLDIADQLAFPVIFAPQGDLRYLWWSDDVPATIEAARNVIYPITQRTSRHPSLLGYSILDDAPARLADKAALAVQAFRESDPDHPASPVLIANNDAVYATSHPGVTLTYQYPLTVRRPPCDLYANGNRDGYDEITSTIRHLNRLGSQSTPMWIVLQAHGAVREYDPSATDGASLRDPTLEELRLQHWLAVGEGVKGIFWFAYDTEQFWTGIRDNPPLFDQLTELAGRMRPLAAVLTGLSKVEDRFTVSATTAVGPHNQPYISTLVHTDGTVYVVVANRSCQPATLAVSSLTEGGQLRDVERNDLYDQHAAIAFQGGDGRIFEIIKNS